MKLFVTIGLALLLAGSCSERMFTFEIPEGYVGWVTVRFRSENCGDTKAVTTTTIRVKSDGTACTSVAAYPTTTLSKFYYVGGGKQKLELSRTGWGEGGMIWAESTEIDGHEYRFFVGSEQQLRKSWAARAGAGEMPSAVK